jgi:16S rRNA (guanine527-N7)-methyltransferase
MQKNLEKYIKLIQKWNKTFNLTGDDSVSALKNHIDDSLSIADFVSHETKLLDIGSGVGFPGIPIKIMRPDLDVVLLDSRRKRISFLNDVILDLGLTKIKAVIGRAEDKNIIQELGFFDVIVSKATWSAKDLLNYAQPYCKNGTIIVAMKNRSLKSQDNIDVVDMNSMCIRLWKTHEYNIANSSKILLIYKVG